MGEKYNNQQHEIARQEVLKKTIKDLDYTESEKLVGQLTAKKNDLSRGAPIFVNSPRTKGLIQGTEEALDILKIKGDISEI